MKKKLKEKSYIVELLNESQSLKKRTHMFNDGKLTFRHLRDTLTDIFSGNVISFSKSVPVVQLYVTSKDGKFFASKVKNVGKLVPISCVADLAEDESSAPSMSSTLKNIVAALNTIDPVLLNRYFANGNNCMKFTLICPPKDMDAYYGKKCFMQYDGVDCFNNKHKLIGSDKKTSFDLYKILKSCPQLKDEFSEVTPEQLCAMRKCYNEKHVLEDITSKLAELIDGIGWGCTLDYYIHDRACRCIVNKALQHDIDISKNGALVDELVARICGTSTRPSKSDLATFAKREGINCNSENYKNFLQDIENISPQLSREIIFPIDAILYYAVSAIVKNVQCLVEIDPNPKAKSFLAKVAVDLFDAAKSIGESELDADNICKIKAALCKLLKYIEIAPQEIRLMYGGKPYLMKHSIDKLAKICEIIL